MPDKWYFCKIPMETIIKDININSKTHIIVEGARMHNLKNVHVAIPKNKLIVITGVSGVRKIISCL